MMMMSFGALTDVTCCRKLQYLHKNCW